MANHNFKFKEKYTKKEINEMIKKSLINEKEKYGDFYINIGMSKEEYYKRLEDREIGIINDRLETNQIANTIDIPEEYCDLWLIYSHHDNDFGDYFNEINYRLAKEFVNVLKNSILNIAFYEQYNRKHNDNIEIANLSEEIKRGLERECKFLNDLQSYDNIVRYYVAYESAKRNINNQNFHEEFNHILNYFSHENLEKNMYIGTTEDALKFLNEIKYEEENITEENFNKTWWNGDVSIIHIKNGNIITNFRLYDENGN